MEEANDLPSSRDPSPGRLPLQTWLREGLRAGVLRPPRITGQQPTPLQVAALVLIVSLLEIALGRFEIAGPASFDLRGWLVPWWSTAALLLLAWWVLPASGEEGLSRPAGLATWFMLWMGAILPANVASQLLGIAQAHGMLPAALEDSLWALWALSLGLWAWAVAAVLRMTGVFGVRRWRLGLLGLGLVCLFALTAWQFPDRPWQAEGAQAAASQEPRLQLSQSVFEAQQDVWQKVEAGLAPERAGVVDTYGLVFSPFADGDVFLRESRMVVRLLTERFDAGDRVIHLANHATTADTLAWATPQNLERAVAAIAARMDRENDVLVVYLTSHGARDFKLAAVHAPLEVEPVSPGDLRRALDKAGIRNRVIAVSACYAGGWVAPLAGDTTLVMTAADADNTSYGCGRFSELTFFGRALFQEQLRKTYSFEQAFAAAVPVIRQREIDAHKDDGFSNPQISVGEKIRPVLRELEQRLAAAATATK